MNSESATIQARVNNRIVTALIDSGSDCYAVVDESLVRRLRIPLVDTRQRRLNSFAEETGNLATKGVAVMDLELGGHLERIYAYVVPGLGEEIYLGKPWFEANRIVYDAAQHRISHGRAGIDLRLTGQKEPLNISQIRTAKLVTAAVFGAECRRLRKSREEEAYSLRAISLADIEKALQPKEEVDPREWVPKEIYDEFSHLFSAKEAAKLPPHRPGIDHEINLQRDSSGKEAALPWGPLYSMSREELLVLRKTLSSLLDRGFIRASSSAAAAPVLFVRKPNGGLRFCCDYRALNAITQRDRYPLPLISETLRALSQAKWFSKLDVVAAFHKMRMAEGDEAKTAFRTRYGLFEWRVCPFGLSGAPASFQRFINRVLRPFLDDFATAYIDDIMIYSSGSYKDHMKKVRRILRALSAAGLHLDPQKCAFGVKKVRYLGFIVRAGEGIACDPEKQQAIREWETPGSIRGVRSFLGFANYYRIFIPDFAAIAEPLTKLTRKGIPFRWGPEEEAAFQELKKRFCEAPILRDWDPKKPTFLETDCSGYALGGVLSQAEEDGSRYAVAYHSQRLGPAEYNYHIHDKEMLAIIRCMETWRSELRSCESFTVVTDHKGLEYFMTKQRLSERQVRWAGLLAQYNFKLQYRPGRLAAVPDALSRREQDLPQDEADEREQSRVIQLIPKEAIPQVARTETTVGITQSTVFPDNERLQQRWAEALQEDETYQSALAAVRLQARSFPPQLKLKLQIAECAIDSGNRLTFRDRLWVPGTEGKGSHLRTRLIQKEHEALSAGHPGRDGTLALVSRRFFWPGIAQSVRQFIRNCDACGRGRIWRSAKRGLLKPLPPAQRPRSDIAMDFITDLPPTGPDGARYLWVIVDRFSKAVTLEVMPTMEAEACALRFLTCHYRFHGMPKSIVSDRGSNWTSRFWRAFCLLAGITQRLSTAYHPQTDGGPERANQEIQAYLRAYIDYSQSDWGPFLPAAQLALNNRESSAIGMSPFFLEHGYHVEPFQVNQGTLLPEDSRAQAARTLLQHVQDTTVFTQAALAATQQRYEDSTNQQRRPAERFEVGDKVWLHLGHYKSPRPSKKLDAIHHKYTVTKTIGSHVVELDVPTAIFPRFHVDLLQRAYEDPLPGQRRDDAQPPPIQVAGEDEWEVQEILAGRWKKRGRGQFREGLVRWKGYQELTWEPVEALQDLEALTSYENSYGPIRENDGLRKDYEAATQHPRRSTRAAEGGGGNVTGWIPDVRDPAMPGPGRQGP